MIIKPDNEILSYSGRIDFDDRLAPVLVYACSSIGIYLNILKGSDRKPSFLLDE